MIALRAGALLVIPAALVMLPSCASQVPPPGGPADTEPPEVIATYPAHGTIGFDDSHLAVEFSEYVDKVSFAASTFISPPLEGVRVEWSGTRAGITFDDTLRAGTTYILTIGTGLKDTRNNRVPESMAFAFSTGPGIDSGKIGGRVHAPDAAGISVFAFLLDGPGVDFADLPSGKPDYITQTGEDGRFALLHLKPGRYRLMAVRDEFQNLLYDAQTDEYGMATGDVDVAGAADPPIVEFVLSREDTSAPFITGIAAPDGRHLHLRFNEPVLHAGSASVVIPGPGGAPAAIITDVHALDTSGRELVIVILPLAEAGGYRVRLTDVTDFAGNMLRPDDRDTLFMPNLDPDTTAPALRFEPEDGSGGIRPGTRVSFIFSEPVDTAALRGMLVVSDDTGAVIRGEIAWMGRTTAVFRSANPLAPGGAYIAGAAADSIRDDAGNPTADSAGLSGRTIEARFKMAEERAFGSIAGRLDAGPAQSQVLIVRASRAEPGAAMAFEATAAADGSFRLEHLPGGNYLIFAWVDADGNGAYSPGRPRPASFAEPSAFYSDTIKVRPRWPVEGVGIVVRP